ncbi:gliding motility-associated lipoprotein GldB [Wenyingzhuangia heitensis]|uniref:Gliding motility-associated lipoprotein GldB n=1 Tax=Wenyingzhuangia heitensis TaxID=1487859 RepID=A0ABX0U4G7_9FLAO|nr:gliding motility lipoprotein GldB [Wenyingzhuangia heitensis]NIJ43739.1 gliding motility-associated lipoprotein GldB [Wenyingzhuangia heitensis]
MKKWIGLSFIISILVACTSIDKKEEEIAKVKVAVKFAMFHDAFFTSSINELSNVKEEYPYMFPSQMSDSLILERQQDTIQQFLYKQVKHVYPTFKKQKKELISLFKHIKYYDNNFPIPVVVTDITGVSYQDRILYANNLLLISLDMYLGKEHEVYGGYPEYLAETFTPDYIAIDVAKKLIETKYKFSRDRTFLGQIIFEGKKLYLTQLFVPNTTDKYLLGYTNPKMEWATKNEAPVWSYFIKNELLYSNDAKLKQRFVDVAPFSKFYMSIDKDSPGQIGKYIGLQIVKAYMSKHQKTPQELMELEAQTILNQSGFKPKK